MKKKTLRIRYIHHIGGSIKDRVWWEGSLFDENGNEEYQVYDYNYKKVLIETAIKNDWNYEVFKLNRKTKKWELVKYNKVRKEGS